MPSTPSLDELEIAVDAAAARMKLLVDENARLRVELAEMSARMRAAGHKLRQAAERLPQTQAPTHAIAAGEAQANAA